MTNEASPKDILGALSRSKNPLTAEQIATELNTFRNKLNIPLNQMLKDGLVSTTDNASGPVAFKVAEGALARFELAESPAGKADNTSVPSVEAASSSTKAGPVHSENVVSISQAGRGSAPAVAPAPAPAPAATANVAATDLAPADPRIQVLQLLSKKTRRNEELSVIAGYEAILDGLLAEGLIMQDEILGEMTFKLSDKGLEQYPKAYFDALPPLEIAPAATPPAVSAEPAAAAPSVSAQVLPVKRGPGRPSKQELQAREDAARAANGGVLPADYGQRPAKKPKASKAESLKAEGAANVEGATQSVEPARKRGERTSKAALARQEQQAAALNGGQLASGSNLGNMPEKLDLEQESAAQQASAPSVNLGINSDDILEINRLFSKLFDDKVKALHQQNETYRKETLDLAKSLADLAKNMNEISERMVKTFS